MSKEVDVKKVDTNNEAELLNSIKYLEDRGRYEEGAYLREKAGMQPLGASTNELEDRLLTLETERQDTSQWGSNDTPEHDPMQAPVTATKSRDPGGEPGPHGANADQLDPDNEEHAQKNRPDTSKRERKAGVANVGGGSGEGQKKKKGDS